MRGCHSPATGRITAPGSSWPQSTRIVQRKRRPTSKVELDDGVAREAGRDRFEIGDFAGRTAAGHSVPPRQVRVRCTSPQLYASKGALVPLFASWDKTNPSSTTRRGCFRDCRPSYHRACARVAKVAYRACVACYKAFSLKALSLVRRTGTILMKFGIHNPSWVYGPELGGSV